MGFNTQALNTLYKINFFLLSFVKSILFNFRRVLPVKMAYYDSTRSALAYAERGMPKLRQELACDELITRQKALVTMSDLMHSTERVHEVVRCGCLLQIIKLLNDSDETIRFKSISVLKTVLQHTVGRDAFLTK